MTKVVYIDDDPAQGEAVSWGLERNGVSVEYATSYSALEGLVRNFRPDVLLFDLEVNGLDGITEMKKARAYAPDVPVIFMSSHADSVYASDAVIAGAEVYLRKPVDIAELLAYINKYAASRPRGAARTAGIGRLVFDMEENVLTDGGQSFSIPNKEAKVLRMLVENMGCIVTRRQLFGKLWPDGNGSNDSLNNYISKIRRLLSADSTITLETLPKQGFRLSTARQ